MAKVTETGLPIDSRGIIQPKPQAAVNQAAAQMLADEQARAYQSYAPGEGVGAGAGAGVGVGGGAAGDYSALAIDPTTEAAAAAVATEDGELPQDPIEAAQVPTEDQRAAELAAMLMRPIPLAGTSKERQALNKQIDKEFQSLAEAKKVQYQAKMDQEEAKASVQQQAIERDRRFERVFQDLEDGYRKRHGDAYRKYEMLSAKAAEAIDPQHWAKTTSLAQKLSLGLQAALASMQDKRDPGVGLRLIQQAIDRDIAVQKMNRDLSGQYADRFANLLSYYRTAYQDERKAVDATRARIQDQVAQELNIAAAKTKKPELQGLLKEAEASIRMDSLARKERLAAARAGAAASAVANQQKMALALLSLHAKGQAAKAKASADNALPAKALEDMTKITEAVDRLDGLERKYVELKPELHPTWGTKAVEKKRMYDRSRIDDMMIYKRAVSGTGSSDRETTDIDRMWPSGTTTWPHLPLVGGGEGSIAEGQAAFGDLRNKALQSLRSQIESQQALGRKIPANILDYLNKRIKR